MASQMLLCVSEVLLSVCGDAILSVNCEYSPKTEDSLSPGIRGFSGAASPNGMYLKHISTSAIGTRS